MRKALEKLRNRVITWDTVKLIGIVCLLAIFCIFLVGPLILLFVKAFQDGSGAFCGLAQFRKYLSSANMLSSLGHTIYISLTATLISVSAAFAMAYSLSRRSVPCKKFFQFISRLPMYAPTMLLGMSLIYLFGNKGILTGLGLKIPLYGKVGIIIAESIFCFPVALMILMVAFSSADNRLYEAADVLHATPFRKLITITLPSIKYGLINAVFVCFTYSFTDFGAPSVVGGNYNVLATDIYKQVIGQQNFNMGAVVGIIMMLPTVLSFFVDRFTSKRQTGAISSRSIPYRIVPNKRADIIATCFCVLVTLFMIGFFGVSLFGSLVTFWPYNLKLTLSHYDFSLISASGGVETIFRSIKVSALAAIIGTIIAFMAAYFVEKTQKFKLLRRIIYALAISPNAIPGTVIGLAYIFFFNPKTFPLFGTGYQINNSFYFLYNTVALLVCVNITHYFSVPFITASTALKRLDNEFESVSDSLKVPFYRTLARITLPLSMQAILEIAVYFFMNSMVTVSAVIFLCTSITQLASVVVVNVQGAGNDAAAAAICMVILAINLIVRILYEIINKPISRKTDAWMKR